MLLIEKTPMISSITASRRSAIIAADRGGDAGVQVLIEDDLLHLAQRSLHRADLLDNVDAVLIFLDHALNAAHVSFALCNRRITPDLV